MLEIHISNLPSLKVPTISFRTSLPDGTIRSRWLLNTGRLSYHRHTIFTVSYHYSINDMLTIA